LDAAVLAGLATAGAGVGAGTGYLVGGGRKGALIGAGAGGVLSPALFYLIRAINEG